MLELPAQSTVEHWKSLTHDNAHNRARLEICKWLLVRFNEAQEKERNFIPPFGELMQIHKVLTAIETIAEDVGHMPSDLLDIRYDKTNQLIALVRRLNPEIADIIYHSL